MIGVNRHYRKYAVFVRLFATVLHLRRSVFDQYYDEGDDAKNQHFTQYEGQHTSWFEDKPVRHKIDYQQDRNDGDPTGAFPIGSRFIH